MINAQEIRIGNFLQYGDKAIKVEKIISDGVNERIIYDYYESANEPLATEKTVFRTSISFKFLTGVKITPQNLERAGFKLVDQLFRNGDVKIEERYTNLQGQRVFALSFQGTTLQISFVHELQNLFYALTGRELTINL